MTKEQTHQIVVTVSDGHEPSRRTRLPFAAHCSCDEWTYRSADWNEIGTKWAWHYIASSDAPGSETLRHDAVRAFLVDGGEYGSDCEACGYPLVAGRTHCTNCAAATNLQVLELSAEAHCETCTEQYDGGKGDTDAVRRWAREHVMEHPGHEVIGDLVTLYETTRCRHCQEEYGGITGDTAALRRWVEAHASCGRPASEVASTSGQPEA